MSKLRWILLHLILMLYVLQSTTFALDVSASSSGSSLTQSFDLDESAYLSQSIILADGEVSQSGELSGSGSNIISTTLRGKTGSATTSLSSKGALSSEISGLVSNRQIELSQDTHASGIVDMILAGESDSNSASQKAGQSSGDLSTSQSVIVGEGMAAASQNTGFAGANGYTEGHVESSGNKAEVASGVNGLGTISVKSITSATDSANAFSQVQGASLGTKVYSAGKATSAEAEAYSFSTARDQLESTVAAKANGHVSSEQNLNAAGDALIYASTADDGNSKNEAQVGDSASGFVSASAGSPQVIKSDLAGDAREITLNAAPAPSTWQSLGGQISGRPFILYDGSAYHHFARGSNGALWDEYNSVWYDLKGQISGDPYALQDSSGRVHVFVRGADSGLWDNVIYSPSTVSYFWASLGGNIDSSPTTQVTPTVASFATVATVGSDNKLWLNNVYTGGGTPSSNWFQVGGNLASATPWIMTHGGKLETFAWGGGADNSLWAYQYDPSNVDSGWHSLGGDIRGASTAVNEPGFSDFIAVATRGGDGKLWVNDLHVPTWNSNWRDYGGQISGTPFAVADGTTSSDYIHTFVRGSDNGLWDARASADTLSHQWYDPGGQISGDPFGIRLNFGGVAADVRGSDGRLWESY